MKVSEVLDVVRIARTENKIPDLSGADLRGADLSWVDLSGADLSWVDLSGADLRGADLGMRTPSDCMTLLRRMGVIVNV